MKNLLLTIAAIVCIEYSGYSTSVPANVAKEIAVNFYHKNSATPIASVILDETCFTMRGTILYYVFNINTIDGFVIVAADDASYPIIGYSDRGHYDPQNSSPEFRSWMKMREKELIYIKEHTLPATNEIKAEWNELTVGVNSHTPKHGPHKAVKPLSNVVWSQGSPFNGMCPGGSVTGCVATSMAQILQYWKYPAHGIGSNTYNENKPQYSLDIGVISRNFYNDYFKWSNMPDTITSPSNPDVALLMLDCGIGVDMNYSPWGSNAQVICPNAFSNGGADSVSSQSSFVKFFGYNRHTIHGYYKNQFADTTWTRMMENELDHGRMINYTGGGDVGHAWVCEGYDSNNYFYMNWGWGGSPNGYYSLHNLNPYSYNFDSLQQALIGIQPPAVSAQFIANNVSVQSGSSVYFSDESLTPTHITSWSWSFPGGTPASSNSQNPLVKYNSPGIYDVTLIVTSPAGSDTLTRHNYIAVQGNKLLPLAEGFNSSFPPTGWYLNNPNNYNVSYQAYGGVWQLYHRTHGGGFGLSDSCMLFNNFNTGYRDYLINEPPPPNPIGGLNQQIYTPAYDFSLVSKDSLYFDVAYAPYSKRYSDTLAIYYSLDGGISWVNIYYKGGMKLATADSISANPSDTIGFVPTSAQWRTDHIQLPPALYGQPSVMFSFENRSYWGGQLYLDNIHVPASPIQSVDNIGTSNNSVILYPNPNDGIFQFTVNSGQFTGDTKLEVYNMLGQQIYFQSQPVPVSQYNIDLSSQPSGIYLYRIICGDGHLAGEGKFIIQK